MKKLFCIAVILTLLCAGAFAESLLNVYGAGTVYVTADRVRVTMGVSMTGSDVAETQREVNARLNAICEALTGAGLEESAISTNSIYIYPQYDYSSSLQTLVGYNVSSSINVMTENIDGIGEYIDAAFGAGANTLDIISFSASDTAEAKKQALEIAVKNAQEKAEVIAAASGRALGELKTVSEGNSASYSPYEDNASDGDVFLAKAEEAAAGTSVHAAQISVTANVQLSYELN